MARARREPNSTRRFHYGSLLFQVISISLTILFFSYKTNRNGETIELVRSFSRDGLALAARDIYLEERRTEYEKRASETMWEGTRISRRQAEAQEDMAETARNSIDKSSGLKMSIDYCAAPLIECVRIKVHNESINGVNGIVKVTMHAQSGKRIDLMSWSSTSNVERSDSVAIAESPPLAIDANSDSDASQLHEIEVRVPDNDDLPCQGKVFVTAEYIPSRAYARTPGVIQDTLMLRMSNSEGCSLFPVAG